MAYNGWELTVRILDDSHGMQDEGQEMRTRRAAMRGRTRGIAIVTCYDSVDNLKAAAVGF